MDDPGGKLVPRPALRGTSALVTGAAGFIGSHLVERLTSDGSEVKAVDCLTDYYEPAQKRQTLEILRGIPGCTVIEADLATCDLTEIVEGVDLVFHQAGQPGVRSSWIDFGTYVTQNVVVTQRLLDTAAGSDLTRFVYASSSSVYGTALRYPTEETSLPKPISPYGVTKLAAEHLCELYGREIGVPTVSLRYFTVYGPRQRPDMAIHRLIEAAMTGDSFPLFGDGRQVRDLTFVADVVEANVLAVTRDITPGAVMNIAGGTSASLEDLIAAVEELVGHRVAIDRLPAQPGDVRRTGGSIDRAARVLGWLPRVRLRDGLAEQVAWHHASRLALERLA